MPADRHTAKRRNAERQGRTGEGWAELLLRLKGYRILGRRVRNHAGEIDLVARSPRGVLCFIEVKARPDTRAAVESVAPRQRARIERAAQLFVAGKPQFAGAAMRFDIVTVSPRSMPRHIRDAWRP
jgi:putative endonuclease